MIAILVSRKSRHEISNSTFVLGAIIWVGAAAVSIFPNYAISLLSFLGIKEGIRTLIFFALIVLSFAVYKLILHVDLLDRDITRLTRAMAMKDLEKYE
jgi:hypothetical protein